VHAAGVTARGHPTVLSAFLGCKTCRKIADSSRAFTGRLHAENHRVTVRWNHRVVTTHALSQHAANSRRLATAAAALAGALLLAVPSAFAAPGNGNGNGNGDGPGDAHGKPAKTTPASKGRSGNVSVLGVVQAVWPTGVVVKQLDGSSVSVPVGHRTKVTIDGKPGRLSQVRPGAVLVATWQAGTTPSLLRFVRPS
jgi:hypothetical protein